MSQINRPPTGLQFLLGSQNFGDNPDRLQRDVVPTIDLKPFWQTGLLRRRQVVGGAIAPGTVLSRPVFAGELWAVKAISVARTSGFTGAGPFELQTAFGINNAPGDTGAVFFGQSPLYTNLDGTTHFAHGIVLDEPIVLEPNASIILYYTQCTLANPDALTLSVLFYNLAA